MSSTRRVLSSHEVIQELRFPLLIHHQVQGAKRNEMLADMEDIFVSADPSGPLAPSLLWDIADIIFTRTGGNRADDTAVSMAIYETAYCWDRGQGIAAANYVNLFSFSNALRESFDHCGSENHLARSIVIGRLALQTSTKESASIRWFIGPIMINLAEALLTFYLTQRSPELLDEAISLLDQTLESFSKLPVDEETVGDIGSPGKFRVLGQLVIALIYRFRHSSRDEDIFRAAACATVMSNAAPAIRIESTTSLSDCFLELAFTKNPLYLDKCIDLGFVQVELLLDPCPDKLWVIFELLAQALFRRFMAMGDDSARMEKFLNLVVQALASHGFCPDNKRRAGFHLYAANAAFALSLSGEFHLADRLPFMQTAAKHLQAAYAFPGHSPAHRDLLAISLSTLGTLETPQPVPEFHDTVQPSSDSVDRQAQVGAMAARGAAYKASMELSYAPPETTLSILDDSVQRVKACLKSTDPAFPYAACEYLCAASECCILRYNIRLALYHRVIQSSALAAWRSSITPEEIERDYADAVSYARAAIEMASASGPDFYPSWTSDGFAAKPLVSATMVDGLHLLAWAISSPPEDSTVSSKDLDEAIQLLQPLVSSNPVLFGMHEVLASRTLVSLLTRRFLISHKREDADYADCLTELLLKEHRLPPHARVRIAALQVERAHYQKGEAVLQAYRTVLDLSEEVLSTEPTLDVYSTSLKDVSRTLLPATIHALNLGELRFAVEVLERGRALLWTYMRRLRTPVDVLADSTNPRVRNLGERFQRMSNELSKHTLSTMGERMIRLHRVGNLASATSARKAGLTRDLNDIIGEIRNIPEFTDFLRPPSFQSLQRAASAEGPVIVVHCAAIRSFALIILHNRDPVYVDLHDAMQQLSEDNDTNLLLDLSLTRSFSGLSSNKHRRVLRSVLEKTANVIVGPVMEKLIRLGIEPGKGRRVWWCPTGPATMIPLHAAGPLPSPDPKSKRLYFMDLYVSSYTPTLSALIEAQSRDTPPPSSNATQALLLVGQPEDPSLANVEEELNTVLSVLPSGIQPTVLLDQDASRSAVSDALHNHGWLHIACHCIPDFSTPTESGFKLGNDETLTLGDIIGLHLPQAQFAFLSACSTAEVGWHISSSGAMSQAFDEVFNPVAAMQFCGFRSVVGTIWAMDDEDGPAVARDFYKELFRPPKDDETKSDTWDPRRAAYALNKAVKKLRKSLEKQKVKGSEERWVNFIHVGI